MQLLEEAAQEAYFTGKIPPWKVGKGYYENVDYREWITWHYDSLLPQYFNSPTVSNKYRMKRSYGGSFYPRPRQLVRVTPITSRNTADLQRAARMRALAMRKRGIRPFISMNRFPEIKALDYNNLATGDPLGITAVITPINLIAAGSSFYNRVGRRIEMKSITFKGVCAAIRTVANEAIGRVVLVYDRQTNGALPAIADMFQTTIQDGTNTTSGYSGINLNYRDRFQIIRDFLLYLPSLTETAGVVTNPGHQDQMSSFPKICFHSKLKGLDTTYRADSAPAVIGDIATGGLYVVVFGSLASATTGWSLFWESRIRYGDK